MTDTALGFDDRYPYIHQCECGNEMVEGEGGYHAFTDFQGKDQFICFSCCQRNLIVLGDYREATPPQPDATEGSGTIVGDDG